MLNKGTTGIISIAFGFFGYFLEGSSVSLLVFSVNVKQGNHWYHFFMLSKQPWNWEKLGKWLEPVLIYRVGLVC